MIVLTSFGLDLVFVEGITAAQSESAIALLIIFLLWRILRIVNGTMQSDHSELFKQHAVIIIVVIIIHCIRTKLAPHLNITLKTRKTSKM